MNDRPLRVMECCCWAMLLCLAAMLLPGCDQHALDKMAIRRVLADFKDANNQSNGAALSGLLTPESFTNYSRILFIASAGKKDDILKLTPFEVVDVVRIRARLTRKDIAGMDGLKYQIYATSKGWYANDDGYADEIKKIEMSPDGLSATATLYFDRRPTKFRLEFRKVNGKWLFHEPSGLAYVNANYEREMRLSGMTKDEIALEIVSEEVGRELGEEIWQPMKP